jgi:hypothetical protein
METPQIRARVTVDTFCVGVFEGRRQGLFCRLAIDCHSRYAGPSLYPNEALEVIGVRRSLLGAGRLVTSLELEIAQLSGMQGWSGPEIAVLAAACVREGIGIRARQTRPVIQLAVGQQPSISGDRGSAKWQHQATAEIEPQSTPIRFTRRIPHRCPGCSP